MLQKFFLYWIAYLVLYLGIYIPFIHANIILLTFNYILLGLAGILLAFNCAHDCVHNTFSKNKQVNKTVFYWGAEKIRAKEYTSKAIGALADVIGAPDSQVPAQLADGVAAFAGDVMAHAEPFRAPAVQALYLAHLEGIVEDGEKAGFPTHRQRISIICHSEGCSPYL